MFYLNFFCKENISYYKSGLICRSSNLNNILLFVTLKLFLSKITFTYCTIFLYFSSTNYTKQKYVSLSVRLTSEIKDLTDRVLSFS